MNKSLLIVVIFLGVFSILKVIMFIAYSFVIKPKVDETARLLNKERQRRQKKLNKRKMMTSGTIGDKKVFFLILSLGGAVGRFDSPSGLLKESKEFLRVAVVDWQFSFCFAKLRPT